MSTSYEIKGTVSRIFEAKQISDKFRKRSFIVDVQDGKYSQVLQLELANDKCSLADSLNEGDEVTVAVNIRGREWRPPGGGETKYFVSLEAWKVDVTKAASRVTVPTGDTSALPF
jgi:single-strand DNA-binding protein